MKRFLYISMFLIISNLINAQNTTEKINNQSDPIKYYDINDKSLKSGDTVMYNTFSDTLEWKIENDLGNNENWKITKNGPSGNYWIPKIKSTTASDGFGLFDSDKLCATSGTKRQRAHLTLRNKINLVGYPNVQLRFQQQYRKYHDSTYVYISNNSVSWIKYNINKNIAEDNFCGSNPQIVSIDISSVAGGQSSVWIRFTYYSDTLTMGSQAGCGYSWMIDDVMIVNVKDKPVKLDSVFYGEYSKIPKLEQKPIAFKGVLKNEGVTPLSNVMLHVKVDTNQFEGYSAPIVTMNSGEIDTVNVATNYTPVVVGKYNISFDAMQYPSGIIASNTKNYSIEITDSVYSRDNDNYQGSGFWLGPNNPYEIGNIYDIKTKTKATSITIVYDAKTIDSGIVKVRLYKKIGNTFTKLGESIDDTIGVSDINHTPANHPVSVTIPFTSAISIEPGEYLATFANLNFQNRRVFIAEGSNIVKPYGKTLYWNSSSGKWVNYDNTPMIRLNINHGQISCDSLPMTVVTSVSLDKCNAGVGSITANPVGGIDPFLYTWSTNPVQKTKTASNLHSGFYSLTVTDARGCQSFKNIHLKDTIYNLTSNINIINSKCEETNGSAKVITNEGQPPYSYFWDTNPPQTDSIATGLIAGTYHVTITDANGCIGNNIANVLNSFAPPSLSISVQPTSACGINDGSATISASGSNPFNFQWNTNPPQSGSTAIGLSSGIYSITVTDINNCKSDTTVVVNDSNAPIISLDNITIITCAGASNGAINVTVSNVTGSQIYKWINTTSIPFDTLNTTSEDISGLMAGTYVLYVKDGSCSSRAQFTINEPKKLTATSIYSELVCNGDTNASINTLIYGGVQPYIFSWVKANNPSIVISNNQNINNIGSGDYIITIKDANNCILQDTTTIINPPAIKIRIISLKSNTDSINPNGAISLDISGGTSSYLTYKWSNNDTTKNIKNLRNGNYTITVTDGNSCKKTETFIVPFSGVGVNEIKNNTDFTIYPNPAKNIVYIDFNNINTENIQIRFFNFEGKQVLTSQNRKIYGKYTETINVSNLKSGIYFVKVITDKNVFLRKLIIY